MALNHIVNGSPVEVKHIDYGTSVGYTKVGSPTISNGVISYTSDGNYIQSTSALAIDQNSDIEIYVRFNKGSISNGGISIVGYSDKWTFGIIRISYGSLISALNGSTPVYPGFSNVLENTWYRAKCTLKNGVETVILYADDGTKINESSANVTVTSREKKVLFSCTYGSNAPVQYVDLNNTYIKVNGKLWFFRPSTNYLVKDDKLVFADSGLYIDDNGTKTYASANIAPVPAGFTFGNTTTSDVGIVDMTTQTFTAVPGATWGKD